MKISVREHDVEQGVFETIRTYRGKLWHNLPIYGDEILACSLDLA